MIHVERASAEDLPGIWAVSEAIAETKTDRAALMGAVERRDCLIAKRGWDVVGVAVWGAHFFGYLFVSDLMTHPDHRRQGVARALLQYAEMTCPQDRLFTSASEANTIAIAVFNALGYQRCGEIRHVNADSTPELIFVKHL